VSSSSISFHRLHLLPLLIVCEHLDVASLLALALACKRFANVVHSTAHDAVWRARFAHFAVAAHFRAAHPTLTFAELYALERLVLGAADPPPAAARPPASPAASLSAWLHSNVGIPLSLLVDPPPPTVWLALLTAPAVTFQSLSGALVLRTLLDSFRPLPLAVRAERFGSFPDFSRFARRYSARDLLLFVACGDAHGDSELARHLLNSSSCAPCRVAVFVSAQTAVEPFKPLMLRASMPSSPSTSASASVASSASAVLVLRSLEQLLQVALV